MFLPVVFYSQYFWEEISVSTEELSAMMPVNGCIDVDNKKILFYPGICYDDGHFNKIFEWDTDSMDVSVLPVSGDIEPPLPKRFYVSFYDSVSEKFYLWGGIDGGISGGDSFSETMWIYHRRTTTWQELNLHYSPCGRDQSGWVNDPDKNIMVLWGGWDGVFFNDLWGFNLDQHFWFNIVQHGDIPPAYCGFACLRLDRKFIIFGGILYGTGYSDELYVLDLDSYNWSCPDDFGDIPSRRRHCRFTFDEEDSLIYLYGGEIGGDTYYNDLYKLDPFSWEWTSIDTEGDVEPVRSAGMVFTKIQGERKILLSGGLISFWDVTNYSYILNLPEVDAIEEDFYDIRDDELLISISPNPVLSNLNVVSDFSGIKSLELYSVSGKLITNKEFNINTTIDFQSLGVTTGLYFIRVSDKPFGKTTSKRIVYIE